MANVVIVLNGLDITRHDTGPPAKISRLGWIAGMLKV